MSSDLAFIILTAGHAYAAVGVMAAFVFVAFTLNSDPAAKGAYAFRPLIIPGLVLLWPLVVARWAGWWRRPLERPSGDAVHHLVAWACIAVIVPALLVYAFVERRARPLEPATIQLSGPRGAP